MKAVLYLCLLPLFFSTLSYGQKTGNITTCSLQIKSVSGMKMSELVRLVNVKEKMTGDSNVNGYRFVYADKNRKSFVQIKAEYTSGSNTTFLDTVSEFDYLKSLSTGTDSNLIRLSYNGFKIYGVVQNPETANGVIESFIMLPNGNEILQFDFNAFESGDAGYQSNNYLSARNSFFGEYTSKLRKCPNQ